MKTKTLVICALIALPVGGVIANQMTGQTSAPTEIMAEDAETKTIKLKVTGMTWGFSCTKKVQAALTKVKGVSKAVVRMPDKATVTATTAVTPEALVKALKAAGYGASVAK